MNHFFHIADYMFENFIHTWPYLLITVPIAVGVNMSGMSRYINRLHRLFAGRGSSVGIRLQLYLVGMILEAERRKL